MTEIDVNKITRPLREERDKYTAEADQMDAKADQIEEEARNAATQILQKGGEDSAPFRREAATLRAHANRFDVLIGREEQEAAAASVQPVEDTLVSSPQSLTETAMDPLPEQNGAAQ